MAKPWRVVMPVIVVAAGLGAVFSVNRHDRPTARIDPAQNPAKSVGWPETPIMPKEPPEDIRKAELSRRAIRPAGDPKRENGRNYEEALNGGETRPHPRAAEPMPPTYCRFVEPVPKPEDRTSGPHGVHLSTVHLFENMSGFGCRRMMWFKNDRGVDVASRDIDRVELVSLLTDEKPSAYVLDEMATPPLAQQAKRRPLDEFERLGLNAVRSGEELVWTRDEPTRMFGAIRAKADCLHCHANAKQGDLLGAFTYYLMVPVDRARAFWER